MTPRLHTNYRSALGARRLFLGMEHSTDHRRLDAPEPRFGVSLLTLLLGLAAILAVGWGLGA